jgi:MFS transporter, LPLT family, lysophospholipid transporter
VLLAASGAFAGLFLIPLNAALQAESDQSKLGKTIAAQNFVDNFGMVFGGLFVLGAAHAGLNASGVFLQLALLIALLVACLRVPPAPALPRSGVPSAGGADQPATREP